LKRLHFCQVDAAFAAMKATCARSIISFGANYTTAQKNGQKKQTCLANVSIGLPMDRKRTQRFDDLCRLKDLSASQGSSSEYPMQMASEEFAYQNH
jgi:hypothetical protein